MVDLLTCKKKEKEKRILLDIDIEGVWRLLLRPSFRTNTITIYQDINFKMIAKFVKRSIRKSFVAYSAIEGEKFCTNKQEHSCTGRTNHYIVYTPSTYAHFSIIFVKNSIPTIMLCFYLKAYFLWKWLYGRGTKA